MHSLPARSCLQSAAFGISSSFESRTSARFFFAGLFAFTGLRTQIGLLNTPRDWTICGVIIAVATLGKLGGSALAARVTGLDTRSSLQLGALMNTRGLMELIALNIGYELGILSQHIFAMLVIMAIVTTVMTGPLVTLFGRRDRRHVSRGDKSPLPTVS